MAVTQKPKEKVILLMEGAHLWDSLSSDKGSSTQMSPLIMKATATRGVSQRREGHIKSGVLLQIRGPTSDQGVSPEIEFPWKRVTFIRICHPK